MADSPVQQDFLWVVSFAGGTDKDRAKLLGQDLIQDLEACEDLTRMLATLAQKMRTDSVRSVLEGCAQEIASLKKFMTEDQWELREICRRMAWPGGTTRIADDSGHAILDGEVLERFREWLRQTLPQNRPSKHSIFVSEKYSPLLDKLMAVHLTGAKRQPKLGARTEIQLPSYGFLSAEEKKTCLKKLGFQAGIVGVGLALSLEDRRLSKRERQKAVQEDKANQLLAAPPQMFDEVSLLSMETKQTKTTGILEKHKFKINLVRLPKKPKEHEDQARSSHEACEPTSQGTSHGEEDMKEEEESYEEELFDLVACRLQESFGVEITGAELRQVFVEVRDRHCDSMTLEEESSRSEMSDQEGTGAALPADGSVGKVGEIVEKLGTVGHKVNISSKRSFYEYWLQAVDEFKEEVVVKHLESEAQMLRAKLSGEEIPREAIAEIETHLAASLRECFAGKALSLFFINRVEHGDGVFRRGSKKLIQEMSEVAVPKNSITKLPDPTTLQDLVVHLATKASAALKETVYRHGEMLWQKAREEVPSQNNTGGMKKEKKHRSARAAAKTWQTFAPWMLPSGAQAVKQSKKASYQIKARS